MKTTKYERKQQLTQLRKASLQKYNRGEILNKYQLEKNNGKGKHIITQDNTIISTLAMHVDKPFNEMTSDDLLMYFKKMGNGNILNYHGKVYSPYTIEQHKVQVCKFFKFLYNWESWMPKPEAIRHININLNRAHKIKDLSQIPDSHDIEKLFETCELGKTPFIVIRDKALISAFYSGARLEEIYNLKINDVIQKDGVIYFTLDGKTGKRAIPISKYVNHLKKYLEVHPQRNNPEAPLWLNQYGGRLKYTAVKGRFVIIHKRSGLKHFSPHDMRHRRATDLAEILTEAQLRGEMGWSPTSKTPANYVHLTIDKTNKKIIEIEKAKLEEENNIEEQVQQRVEQQIAQIEKNVTERLLQEFTKLTTEQKKNFNPGVTPDELVHEATTQYQ